MHYWFDVYFGIHNVLVRNSWYDVSSENFDGMLVISYCRSSVFLFLVVSSMTCTRPLSSRSKPVRFSWIFGIRRNFLVVHGVPDSKKHTGEALLEVCNGRLNVRVTPQCID